MSNWLEELERLESYPKPQADETIRSHLRNRSKEIRELVRAVQDLGDISHLYEYDGDEDKCEWRKLAKALANLLREGE